MQLYLQKLHEGARGEILYAFHSLCLAAPFYETNPEVKLAAQYQAHLHAFSCQDRRERITLLALYWQAHAEAFERVSMSTGASLKEAYLKPLLRFIEHLAQYTHGLVTRIEYPALWDLLTQEASPYPLDQNIAKKLNALYSQLQFLRCQNQTDKALVEEALYYIAPLYPSILRALSYQGNESDTPTLSFDAQAGITLHEEALKKALENPYAYYIWLISHDKAKEIWIDSPYLAKALCYHVSQRENHAKDYHVILYPQVTDACKLHYYRQLKLLNSDHTLWQIIGNIPSRQGERLYWAYEYKPWIEKLKKSLQSSTASKALLHCTPIKKAFPVDNALLAQFWDSKKNELKPSPFHGNHLVYKLALQDGDNTRFIYLKCYPGLPGVNDSLQYLYRRLFGATDGLPWSVTGLLTIGPKQIPVLISDDAGNKVDPDDLRLTHSLLTHYYLSKLLLFSILTNPEDGKCDNYALIKNDDGTYIIRSIDNDQSFAEGREATSKTSKNTFYDIKTVLFCLEEMQEPLHRQAVEEFIALDARSTLKAWLFDLVNLQSEYQHLFQAVPPFTEKEIKAHRGSYLDIVLPLSIVTRMSYKFEQLQQLLGEDPTLTPLALLQEVEPAIAHGYQLVLDQPLSPTERFDKLVKENQWYAYNPKTKDYTTTKTYASQLYQALVHENSPETVTPQVALTILNQQFEKIDTKTLKNVSEFTRNIQYLTKASVQAREETLKYAQLNQLPATNRHALLTLIAQYTDFEKLYFNFPQHALSETLLKKILDNNRGLKKLYITNALALNTLHLLEGKPIETLVINQLPNIKGVTLTLPSVKVVIMENCPHLKSIVIQAPHLERLRLLDCPLLNNVSLPVSLDLREVR